MFNLIYHEQIKMFCYCLYLGLNQFDRLFERDAHPDADIQDVAQRIGRSIQACGEGAGKQNHQWDFRFTRRCFAR